MAKAKQAKAKQASWWGIPAFVVVVLLLGGLLSFFLVASHEAEREQAQAFLEDIRAGDLDAAYERTSPGFRSTTPRVLFEAHVQRAARSAPDSTSIRVDRLVSMHDRTCLDMRLTDRERQRATVWVVLTPACSSSTRVMIASWVSRVSSSERVRSTSGSAG